MRILFAGTPEFARLALAALVSAGHDIVLVLTQPDRKAGRGLKTSAGAVKAFASAHSLGVFQPATLREPEVLETLRAARPDVLVVAAYGRILPQALLDLAPLGALNIHASLLPRWRGAAPIQRAILSGDAETGVSIMQMDAGLDTGPLLAKRSLAITPAETARSLHDRLARLGAEMIVETVRRLSDGPVTAVPQPAEGVTYAHKIEKPEAALDWRNASEELDRRIRAFNPAPGANARLGGEELKIWHAHQIQYGTGDPGCVISSGSEGLVVACGDGALRLTELQRAGGKRLAAREFLAGHPVAAGARFELPAD
jgi:methionyl-tRNA formyltransferase